MTLTSNPPASGLPARLVGVLLRPRRAMQAATAIGWAALAATWLVILAAWLGAGAWLLARPVGRQALVDERVRVVEALGGQVDDAQYQAWQAAPPWSVYFTSGGRVLLFPLTTVAVAPHSISGSAVRCRESATGRRSASPSTPPWSWRSSSCWPRRSTWCGNR